MLNIGTKIKFIVDGPNYINKGDTGIILDKHLSYDAYEIKLDKNQHTVYGVPSHVVEPLIEEPAVGSLRAAAKIFGVDPAQIAPPWPCPVIDLSTISPTTGSRSRKTIHANGHGVASSIGPVEEFAKPFEPRTFPSYSCNCGASAVGVEKHDHKCPRKAIEDQIVVKQ